MTFKLQKFPSSHLLLLYFLLERRNIGYLENIESAYNFYEADFNVNIPVTMLALHHPKYLHDIADIL